VTSGGVEETSVFTKTKSPASLVRLTFSRFRTPAVKFVPYKLRIMRIKRIWVTASQGEQTEEGLSKEFVELGVSANPEDVEG